jgi:hypothetical protein
VPAGERGSGSRADADTSTRDTRAGDAGSCSGASRTGGADRLDARHAHAR